MVQQKGAVKIVCCYARKDEHLLNELKRHLSALQKQDLLDVWHDRNISPGAPWDQEIKRYLGEAHIILLLISPDFISSNYCYSTEMKIAFERHEKGKARVIPVILRPFADWENIPAGKNTLGDFQALPTDVKPVTQWSDSDEAWADVAKGIKRVVNELLGNSSTNQSTGPRNPSSLQSSQGEVNQAVALSDPRINGPVTVPVSSDLNTVDTSFIPLSRPLPAKPFFKTPLFRLSLIFLLIFGIIASFSSNIVAKLGNPFLHTGTPASSEPRSFVNSPMAGFDPAHTRYNPYEHLISPMNISHLTLDWTALVGSSTVSTPAVVNGIIYIGSQDFKLYAYNATGCSKPSCSPLWFASTAGNIASSPAVADGIVYVGSNDGALHAYNAAGCGNGKTDCPPAWRYDATESYIYWASPTVINGMAYIGSLDSRLYAYSASNCGKPSCPPLWRSVSMGGAEIHSTPAVVNGVIYIGSNDGRLYAYSAAGCAHNNVSCPPLWYSANTGDHIASSPTVVKKIVYVGSDANTLNAYNTDGCGIGKTNCPPLWSAMTGGKIDGSPAVASGVVYIGTEDHRLYAYNATGCGKATCSPLWVSSPAGQPLGSPMVANGVVYVASNDGRLYTYNATGCERQYCLPLWVSPATGGEINSSPVVVNGRVYIGSSDGKLYVFHLA